MPDDGFLLTLIHVGAECDLRFGKDGTNIGVAAAQIA